MQPAKSVFVGDVYMVSKLTTLYWKIINSSHPWKALILCNPTVTSCLEFFD